MSTVEMPTGTFLAIVLAAHLAVGCASKTMIVTVPEGAKVYVNEEYLGRSPVTYSDRRVIGATNTVRFDLENYEPKIVHFRKDEKMNILAAIGAVAVVVPVLWIMDYKEEHHYELEPLSSSVLEHGKVYSEAAKRVRLGDNTDTVLEILEPTQAGLSESARRQPERYIKDGVRVEIFYFRSRIRPDGSSSDEDFTPYVFNDGRLVAVGWSSLERRIRLRGDPGGRE